MASKRVRILTAMAGFPAGAVCEVDESKAVAWLGRGTVEETKDKVTHPASGTERATTDPTK